jgi:hypothetical protein
MKIRKKLFFVEFQRTFYTRLFIIFIPVKHNADVDRSEANE